VIRTLEALGIDRLTVAEKAELIALIWESIPADAVPELPREQLEKLKRRVNKADIMRETRERNAEAARAINDEALRDPESPYAGKYVGLAHGQVAVVADGEDELWERLQQIEPYPWFRMVFRAGEDSTPAVKACPNTKAVPLPLPAERPATVTNPEVVERNRALARAIHEEARSNPQSPYAGKFVGLANGQVVVVSDDLNGLARRLREVEPNSRNLYIVDTKRDPTKIHRI